MISSVPLNLRVTWSLSGDFSDLLGPLAYSEEEGEVFLGRSTSQPKQISSSTKESIDSEVRAIIDRNYQRAEEILRTNMHILHLMADALMKYETIDVSQIDAIMEGREPDPPSGWTDNSGSGGGSPVGGVKATDDAIDADPAKNDESKPAGDGPVADPDPAS